MRSTLFDKTRKTSLVPWQNKMVQRFIFVFVIFVLFSSNCNGQVKDVQCGKRYVDQKGTIKRVATIGDSVAKIEEVFIYQIISFSQKLKKGGKNRESVFTF